MKIKGKNLGLALQGGGSYASFTAGVLTGLFEKKNNLLSPDDIHSISGTSGGAINATLLGLAIHEGEKDVLKYVKNLWEINRLEKIIKDKIHILKLVPDKFLAELIGLGRMIKDSTPAISYAVESSAKSIPNTFESINELIHEAAPGLPEQVDKELFENKKPFITIAATEAKSGMAHYFTNNKNMRNKFEKLLIGKVQNILYPLTLQSVFASMSHPIMFKSMEFNGFSYWDGYYTSNPPFMYLFREGCDEIILVRLIQMRRDEIKEDVKSINDRVEEIIQNLVLNQEIGAYFAIREVLYNNRWIFKKANLELKQGKFTLDHVFHEIRLLKPGNIEDEGFPLAELVEKLINLGKKVVLDKNGFKEKYQNTKKGLHIVSEIDFETEDVVSRAVDYDQLLFEA